MTSSSLARPRLSWRAKACLLLVCFIAVQIAAVSFAVADRVAPTVKTKDATIQYGETLDLAPFVRVTDDRSTAEIVGLSVSPEAGTSVTKDLKTVTFQKSGDYVITVHAKDASGNIGSGELKVTMEPRPQPEIADVPEGGQAQPDISPFPVPDATTIPGQTGRSEGTFAVGQDLPAGLYKLIGIGERKGRVDAGSLRVLKHVMKDVDVDIAILDALTIGGDFNGSLWVYLSEGTEFELDSSTVAVAESDVPPTLYAQVHLDGMYCAGIDIEPGKYRIQANPSSERDSGSWAVGELYDFVYFTYIQDVRMGSVSATDETDEGDEVWVYRGQFLKLENCTATKIS